MEDTKPEKENDKFELHLFVKPPDELDSKGNGHAITITMEELKLTDKDFKDCKCSGKRCEECEFDPDKILMLGHVSEEQQKYVKVPFSFYTFLPNIKPLRKAIENENARV